MLAVDPVRGVLLQHRVGWSHFGGTWGLPGGAMHQGESAVCGALREAQEEAGVPNGVMVPRFTHVFDAGVWTYTTVAGDVVAPFAPEITDPESLALEWVPVDQVDDKPLHPGFGAAWPALRDALSVRPVLLIDAANVVGSVPNRWWKDRVAAADNLYARLEALAASGVASGELGLGLQQWFPAIVMVTEGKANGVCDAAGRVMLVRANGAGDDELVFRATDFAAAGLRVTAVTSDRALTGRLEQAGADVRGVSWLKRLLDQAPATRLM
nr:NUDIX hydrolase [Microbacterium amylolyticum]